MTYILLVLLSALLSLPAYLAQDDDFSLSLPFTSATENFDTFGSTTLHSDTIVLTPHSPSHMVGAIWAKRPNPHAYWEAEFSFRVSGGERGGTGLAFWYAAKRGLGGPVFGNADQWDGLALFFDGNTGAKSTVRGHLNAGNVRYISLADPLENAFGSCPYVFRGVGTPIVVKVTNSRDSFRVTIDENLCFETDHVILPSGYFFGISAATGDAPDHHQLFGFKVTPLEGGAAPPATQHEVVPSEDRPMDELRVKLDELTKQFQDWQDQTNVALRRIETSITSISKAIGTMSNSLNQLQKDVPRNGGSITSMTDTLQRLTGELLRLENALKEHMSGHVGVLSQSLVGRGGFWRGIWMVVGVQLTGWVVYEFYRTRKDKFGKKII